MVNNYNSISSQFKKNEVSASTNKVVRKVPTITPTVTPIQARKKASTKR